MAYGILVRNAAGEIVLDSNERIARLLEVFDTGTTAGSRTYDAGGGQIAFTVSAPVSVFYDGPAIYLNGNTISWDFSINPSTGYSVKVLVWAF